MSILYFNMEHIGTNKVKLIGLPRLFKHIFVNPLNPELNPICYLLALLAHHFLHVSRVRVKSLTLRLLMLYIYIYIYIYICIYDISSLRVNQLLYCVSLKIYNNFANYFCELKFSGNTHQRP